MKFVLLIFFIFIRLSFAETKTVSDLFRDMKFETKSFLVGQATIDSNAKNINAELPKLLGLLDKTKILSGDKSMQNCIQICRIELSNGSSFASQTATLIACKNNWGSLEQASKSIAQFDSSAFEAFCKTSHKKSKIIIR